MTGVGVAMVKLTALVEQHLGDLVGHSDSTDWQVAGRQTFGHRHDIGLYAHGLKAPPVAGTPETTNNLIGHQQYVVLLADTLDLGPIGRRRDDDTAGTLDGLAASTPNLRGADLQDAFFNRLSCLEAELLAGHVAAKLEPVGLHDMFHARQH